MVSVFLCDDMERTSFQLSYSGGGDLVCRSARRRRSKALKYEYQRHDGFSEGLNRFESPWLRRLMLETLSIPSDVSISEGVPGYQRHIVLFQYSVARAGTCRKRVECA